MRYTLPFIALFSSACAQATPSSFSIVQLNNQMYIELVDRTNNGQLQTSTDTARKTMLVDNSYVFPSLPTTPDSSGKTVSAIQDVLYVPDSELQWEMDEDLISQAKQKFTALPFWFYWGEDPGNGNSLTCPTTVCSDGSPITSIDQYRALPRAQQVEVAKANVAPSIGTYDGYKRAFVRNLRDNKNYFDQSIVARLGNIGITKGTFEFRQSLPGGKEIVSTMIYNNGKAFNPGPTIVDKQTAPTTDLVVNYYPYYRDARVPLWVYSSPGYPYLQSNQGIIEVVGYKTIDTKVKSATYAGNPGPYDMYNGVNSSTPPDGISQSFSSQPLKCFIKKDPNTCNQVGAPDLVSLIQNYEAETGNRAGNITVNYYWPTFVTAGGYIDPPTDTTGFPGYDIWTKATSRILTSVHTDHQVQPLEKYWVPPSTTCSGTPSVCTTTPGYYATRNAGPSYFLCAEEKNILTNNNTTGIGVSTMKQKLVIDRLGNIVQAPINTETKSACSGFGACDVNVNVSSSYTEQITSTQGAAPGSRDAWFANMIYSPLDDSYQGRAYKNSPISYWLTDGSKGSVVAKTASNNRTYYEGIYDYIYDAGQVASNNHYLGQDVAHYQVPAITTVHSSTMATHSYIVGEGSPPDATSLCATTKPLSIGGSYAQ